MGAQLFVAVGVLCEGRLELESTAALASAVGLLIGFWPIPGCMAYGDIAYGKSSLKTYSNPK